MIKYILLFTVLFIACGKNENLIIDQINKTGTKLLKEGTLRFTYNVNLLEEVTNPNGFYKSQKYIYDSNQKLIEVNFYTTQNILKDKEFYSYDNEVLVQSTRQRINEDLRYEDIYITNYFYNHENKLIKTTSIDPDNNQLSSLEFTWSNNNISKVINIDGNNLITYFTEYEYDDKTSYKFCNPFYKSFGENLSRNNITQSKYTTVGNLIIDFICQVCPLTYEYEGNLPISVTNSWGQIKEIEFD